VAYDAALAERIRELVGGESGLTEKKMFGGLAFLIGGNMAIAASGQGGLLVRVDPESSDHLVSTTNARPVEIRGRKMQGWLRVDDEHVRTKRELARWIGLGTKYARSLPAEAIAVPRQIVLLRGINVGSHNRIAMPELRRVLAEAGFADVATYVQSGNVVLTSGATPDRLAARFRRLIEEAFGLEIGVVVRTRSELAKVVARNPLRDVAVDPKRYQVSFLAEKPKRDVVQKLAALAVEPERFVANGRELYAWHPAGVARSKLWAALAGPSLGVTATARNWTTVTKLLELAVD